MKILVEIDYLIINGNKNWILLSLLGSITIVGCLGLIPFIPIVLLVSLLVFGGFNSALRDVSVDGIMCIDGKKAKACDKIQAIQWIAITVASILVGLGGGYLADHFNYKVAYLSLVPIYLIIIGIVLKYRTTILKKKVETKYVIMNRNRLYHIGPNAFWGNLIESIKSYKELFLNKKFLIACLFLFLYKYNPSFNTPLMFIQRDIFGWSGQWMGGLSAIVSCFEILGAIIFFRMCKKINIKKWLYISVFLGALTTLFYLYFTPISAVVYGILFSILGMFVHLIIMSWMAKTTLPGKEATSFALLCSVSNLALSASTISGAFLFPKIGLQWLIVASALTSFACLPLIKRLEIK